MIHDRSLRWVVTWCDGHGVAKISISENGGDGLSRAGGSSLVLISAWILPIYIFIVRSALCLSVVEHRANPARGYLSLVPRLLALYREVWVRD